LSAGRKVRVEEGRERAQRGSGGVDKDNKRGGKREVRMLKDGHHRPFRRKINCSDLIFLFIVFYLFIF